MKFLVFFVLVLVLFDSSILVYTNSHLQTRFFHNLFLLLLFVLFVHCVRLRLHLSVLI